jgi:glutathione synthase/RimK-type ligase-like ATP-grasp enzyme
MLVLDPFAGEPSSLALRLTADGSALEAELDGRPLRPASVWWRLKPAVAQADAPAADPISREFVEREWAQVLEALAEILRGAAWVNDPEANRRARAKPLQLVAAARAGFDVAPTMVTNDASAAARFAAAQPDGTVYKALSWYFRPPDRMLYTRVVDAAAVSAAAAEIRRAPCIFQRRVDKAHELRVTVVGQEVFAVRIDAESVPAARLDWRRAPGEVPCRPCDLDPVDAARLLTLHRALGLTYGAYDLIATHDGRLVFLEVNPVGQWLWLEERLGLPIADAIARELSPDGAA